MSLKSRDNNNSTTGQFAMRPVAKWVRTAVIAGMASSCVFTASAQEDQGKATEVEEDVEIISVTGTRRTIQDQIAIKREATTVVDGLSSEDIGDLPALSIGEALESITGAASHRENGGATEITIRGLGPFLSATHINGREATNGSGDRSVNFSQFPSELVKKVAIYKTQDASMIEGGVAGVIALETITPLDFGKQRVSAEVKLNYNPDEGNVDNSLQSDAGYRGTFSYVDQFEFDNGQAVGVSFGVQRQDISQPEAEYRSSSPSGSSLWACLNDPNNTNEGFYRSSAGDCEDQVSGSSNQGYDTEIDPETGKAVSDGTPYAWTGSSRSYRQNETSDERDAMFFALQYQPSADWDVNFDAQISDRTQQEARHDLIFLQKRATPGVTGPTLVTNDVGGILHWEGEERIESAGEQFSREENYQGYGINIEHTVTDRLTVDLDLAYSKTEREELQISNRGRTSGRNFFSWDMGDEIPHFTLTDFDVTDISNFTDSLRTRLDRENVRENEVISARLDFDYTLDGNVFTSIQGGIRTSEMTFLQYGGSQGNGSRNEFTLDSGTEALDVLQGCQIDFPESGFLSSVSDGDIVTNVDSDGNVVDSGTGSSWATYDNVCFSQAVAGSNADGVFAYPEVEYENAGTIDVTEKTTSVYLMANYDTEMFGKFIRGNFGLRIVDTEVTSIGFRNSFDVVTSDTGVLSLVESDNGSLDKIKSGGDYTKYLPSFNLVIDYSEDILFRAGIYRGMSRADPSDLGYSRTFQEDTEGTATSISDLLVGVNGSGNPDTQPLMSWNYDAAFEWYPNEDSILALSLYYKQFNGGFQQQTVIEDFTVAGETVSLPITNSVTSDEDSEILGLEASFSYRWDNGIGMKFGYNYADTDFEFQDSLYGDTFETDVDGNTTQLTDGIIESASVPGFSKHVFSSQLYYQIGGFDTAVIYKYRSEYFQPYTTNGTRLRYVDGVGVWEMRASYKIDEHFRVKAEAINLFSAPKSQDFFVEGNLGEVNDYGPRLFLGLSYKL
ncbi:MULTISPECIES: TonB-dependent receptor [Pseudoalteromonas]|uniref:TonB-dependent receptor n=1 Tax=Pseudoalteromonas TaxID=53246 RepID=UPI0002319850|nr:MULTISPECIES: TonB-dependent receptor [Pseudoalteromonas]MBH0018319.1 TonB-dependent receptor [Pseudoalteromonas sp. NGC95]MBH0036133.1 TonB-dependent receptor [Pseudoalteromonas sp. NZS71_1]MBH0062314.1 TonB-dependent receptor [Pseudoalteromonas sp. NZS71]MBZ2193578.1 TonB-dependent receptor [Pseudoalteromonas arctica]MDN3382803.1 TonB-dependent receptor [Pseudoalteromonas sp. APC 3358]